MPIYKGAVLNYEIQFKHGFAMGERVMGKLGLVPQGQLLNPKGSNLGVAFPWTEKGRLQVNINGYRDSNQVANALASAVASIGFPAFSVKVWF